MTDPIKARNDDADPDRDDDQDGQVANPGPVPAEAEDMSDTGGGPGGLAPQAKRASND
ncbi:hypothetical protein [Aeromicrobium sp.]|uniref:hypothetical protein n=1 Tax=Aeromicrobium sp. TaxID=1871063 RepID=UPI0019C9E47F|nr:hypothetical protein [Aeromicrobium sp.]MBC7632867.1 hypothetical protein [Aeromicrobium sp.]